MNHVPLYPTPWTNDGDMLAHSPTGEVVPPGHTVMVPGATLRDYFAAKAIDPVMRLIADGKHQPSIDQRRLSSEAFIAVSAYRIADAMLKARGGRHD
jgi:hypothetical protein